MADEASAPSSHDQSNPPPAPVQAPVTLPAIDALLDPSSAAGTPGPATGTITPALSELPPDQMENSLRVSLADLCAKGAALMAHKSYEEAAEIYARAAEMQAEMNGEMSPANAEILFLYGRCLFKVGQSKSDVLGGKAPDNKPKKPTNGKPKAESSKAAAAAPADARAPAADDETPAQRITEEGVAIIAKETTLGKEEEKTLEAKKPLFQFTGDENWDDSDGEEPEGDAEAEGGEGEEGEDDDDDDDLAVAFEILDLARVLFAKRLEQGNAEEAPADGDEKAKDKVVEEDEVVIKHIKERLADTHDLLAEISLENEKYQNAIVDARTSLGYKKELYPKESEIIAEAHFKLSLALEFASMTTSKEDGQEAAGPQDVDQALRDEAANELEAAIDSTKLKLQNKEVELATMHSPDENEATRKQIADVKDVIADMEQRLVELRKAPLDVNAILNGPAANAMGGILGATLGETAAQTQARIEEAKKSAKDLSGLVRKKAKDEPAAAAAADSDATNGTASATTATNGKRKAEEPAAGEEESKKAKVDEPVEA